MTFGPFKFEGMFLLLDTGIADQLVAFEIKKDITIPFHDVNKVGTSVYVHHRGVWMGNRVDSAYGDWFVYVYDDTSVPQEWMAVTYEQAFALHMQGLVADIVFKGSGSDG